MATNYTSAFTGSQIDAVIEKLNDKPLDAQDGGTGLNELTLDSFLVGNGTEDVQLLTPAQVLSKIRAISDVTDCYTFDNTIKTGFYSMMGDECTDYPEDFPLFRFGMMSVETRFDLMVKQTMYYYGGSNSYNVTAVRSSLDGGETWSKLEFINPPMEIGAEYRTTDRFNGKVVYAKLVNCGTVTASGNCNTNISAISNLVSSSVSLGNIISQFSSDKNNENYFFAYTNGNYVWWEAGSGIVSMGDPVFALLKYTKD